MLNLIDSIGRQQSHELHYRSGQLVSTMLAFAFSWEK